MPARRPGRSRSRAALVIEQIGDEKNPYFEDMLFTVVLSEEADSLTAVRPGDAGQPPSIVTHDIVPRLDKGDSPVIGIGPAESLKLLTKRNSKERDLPVQYNSAAAQAKPPFASTT